MIPIVVSYQCATFNTNVCICFVINLIPIDLQHLFKYVCDFECICKWFVIDLLNVVGIMFY